MLSHPLRIVALVSRYLTNKLIRSRPLLRWNHTFALRYLPPQRLSGITHSFPWLSPTRGYVTYPLLPRLPLSPLRVLARLACLIHAANVHSEPGSNPSICMTFVTAKRRASRRSKPDSNARVHEHEKIMKSSSLI